MESQLSTIERDDPKKILCFLNRIDSNPVKEAQQQRKAKQEEYQKKQTDVSHETEDNSDSDNQNDNDIADIDPKK